MMTIWSSQLPGVWINGTKRWSTVGASANIIEGDIRVQTRAVLERIAAMLGELGTGMADVVRATIWLADLEDFAAFNEEYKAHFLQGLPTRSTVQASLYKGARVEIEVQAWVGG